MLSPQNNKPTNSALTSCLTLYFLGRLLFNANFLEDTLLIMGASAKATKTSMSFVIMVTTDRYQEKNECHAGLRNATVSSKKFVIGNAIRRRTYAMRVKRSYAANLFWQCHCQSSAGVHSYFAEPWVVQRSYFLLPLRDRTITKWSTKDVWRSVAAGQPPISLRRVPSLLLELSVTALLKEIYDISLKGECERRH